MINIQTAKVLVSLLPTDHKFYQHYAISVEWKGNDQWAVVYNGYVLNDSGDWDYDPPVSEREENWLENHRFDYDTAIRLAIMHAPQRSQYPL